MTYSFRRATAADVDIVQGHRDAMFLDMGIEPSVVEAGSAAGHRWHEAALRAGSYVGVLALDPARQEQVVGGVGVTWLELPPNMHAAVARRGYVLNMYVEPAHRRRGLARGLLEHALQVSREAGVDSVTLHASDAGRGLYEQLGFTPTNEMRRRLP